MGEVMLKSQELEKVIRMFNDKSTVAKDARVSVELPDKSLWDIGEIFLVANKIVGSRETHRIVIRINKEIASPGSILWKL
jgi:hypothetical protein|tara:strand:+ start:370 stop:609 length:240 start_codon:yes stop_codon:yes gene_type:complete